MQNQVNFFYDRNQASAQPNARYAITAYLKDEDTVVIKAYDFEKGELSEGVYDSDGGCLRGDELLLDDEIAANEIVVKVFQKMESNDKELMTW